MSTPVKLPELGESVTEGTITRWLKQVGDTVEVDEPLLEVSTDKVDTEIPSPVAGTILEIKAEEDETVEVGAELCVIGDEGESSGSDSGSDDASESEDEPESDDDSAESDDSAEEDSGDSEADDSSDEDSGDEEESGDDEESGDEDSDDESMADEEEEQKPAKPKGGGGAAVRRSRCPSSASRSPRAPSPAG